MAVAARRPASGAVDLNELRRGAAREHAPLDASGNVQCFFGGLADALLGLLAQAPPAGLVGCCYYLTHPRLLAWLVENKMPTALVVQKTRAWKRRSGRKSAAVGSAALRAQYDALVPLNGDCAKHSLRGPQPVRCLGICRTNAPLVHHKFLVWLDAAGRATAVWTGSFNFTRAAETHLENAVFIRDADIAARYLAEFRTLRAASEPLDWTRLDLA